MGCKVGADTTPCNSHATLESPAIPGPPTPVSPGMVLECGTGSVTVPNPKTIWLNAMRNDGGEVVNWVGVAMRAKMFPNISSDAACRCKHKGEVHLHRATRNEMGP